MKKILLGIVFLSALAAFSCSNQRNEEIHSPENSQQISDKETPDLNRPESGKSICVDRCGDGICQEFVCMGSGCPCPESLQRCPKDCSEN